MAISEDSADNKLYRGALQDIIWAMDRLVDGGKKGKITWVANGVHSMGVEAPVEVKLGRGAKRAAVASASCLPAAKRFAFFLSVINLHSN